MLQLPLNVQLDDSSTFDNFEASHNLQLIERLSTLADATPEFIFIWGASETGKTHLAQALCHSFAERNLLAAYLPLDNESFDAEILQGMHHLDLVCIDNVEAVKAKSEWEVALFNLYNELKADHKHLIIFSNAAPAQTQFNLADLNSRLSAMEIYKLEALSDTGKISLFQSRATHRGLDIPAEVAKFILSRYSRSVADLVEILDTLDRSSMMLQRKVTIPLVKEILDQ
ncbi:DnaA regulatory inactivator Hda [Aliikangiella sp. IMCC44632]